MEYLGSSELHSPAIGKYYQAVFIWESCFLNLQMFVDSFTKTTGSKAFAKGDGSQDQRAYDVANAIKHWAGVIEDGKHLDEHTIPLWLSNDGFHTYRHAVTYSELAGITFEVAKAANDLQNPRKTAAAP